MKERNNRISKFFSKGNIQKMEVQLDMIDFQADNIFYTYSPALDLMGYGKSQKEAHDSWEVVLREYLKYTHNKGTLTSDLKAHGWNVTAKQLNPPTITWLIEHREQVRDVYDNHSFSKSKRPIKVPLALDCA